jgi:hypothetical protein
MASGEVTGIGVLATLAAVALAICLALASCSGEDSADTPGADQEARSVVLTGDDRQLAEALELDPDQARAALPVELSALESRPQDEFEAAALELGFETLVVRLNGEWLPVDTDAPRPDRVNVSVRDGVVDVIIGIR